MTGKVSVQHLKQAIMLLERRIQYEWKGIIAG
jgi:hypothetical protein